MFYNVSILLDLPISNSSLIEISKSGKILRTAVLTFDGSSEGSVLAFRCFGLTSLTDAL